MSLTLLAHGSPDPRHARDVAELSGRLKVAGIPTQVAYLDHHAPSPPDAARAVAEAGAEATTVVPLFLSPAYHARVDVPVAVQTMREAAPELPLACAQPVGLDATLLDACAELAVGSGLPIDEGTGIVLAMAGSRDQRAVASVEALVRELGPALVDRLGARALRAAYLDGGRPIGCVRTLMQRLDRCSTLVVVTAVIADGVLRDRIVATAAGYDLPVAAGTLANTNALADLVVMRAGAAPTPAALGRVPAAR
jgi:sirohydrochlorin ferrochelatase